MSVTMGAAARLLKNLSLKAASLGFERGSRFALTLAAARLLGERAFGRFVFASTATGILALTSELGLGLWTTRELARTHEAPSVVRTGLGIRAVTTGPYVAAVLFVAWLAASGEGSAAVVLLGGAALLNSLADQLGAALRGGEHFAMEARLNLVRAASLVTLGGPALIAFRTLTSFSVALLCASVVALGYGLRALAGLHALGGALRVDRAAAREALRGSLPIWAAGLVSLLYFKVDTFFVRAFSGEAELGAYGAAYKVFEGAMLVPSIALAVTFPGVVRAHAEQAHAASCASALERRIAASLLGAGLAIGGAIYAARGAVVTLLFGAGFERAVGALSVLALGLPLVFLNYALTHFLLARRRETTNTALAIMMLGVVVPLDLWLIPRAGGAGAARATVVAEIALTLGALAALARPKPPAASAPSPEG